MRTSARSSVRTILLLLLAALSLGGGAWFYWHRRADQAPEFSTTTVTRGDVVQVVTATGDIEPVLNVNVSSQISGIVSRLFVDWNTPVKKDQVLAQLDPATYQANVLQAEGQLANAKANYQLTLVNTNRTRELFQKALVTRADLDQAEAQLLQADAQVKIQTASLEMNKVNLARCTIYSPIDGIVISRQVDVGNTVAASLSAPTLFVIANDLTKMQIIAAVAEADIGNVAVGQNASFTVDAYPSRQFRGRVSQIRNSPETQQNVVIYQTIIDVNNPDLKLRPGMTANVSIIVAERDNALRVANAALRARIPEALLPRTPAAAGAAAAASMTEEQRRAAVRKILQEVGYASGSGPMAPEVQDKARQRAKALGLDIDFSRFGGGRDNGAGNGGAPPVVTRTVYRLGGSGATRPALEPVSARLGVTDGVVTEVLSGLNEGDLVVTAVTLPGGAGGTARPAANPFAGGPGGLRR